MTTPGHRRTVAAWASAFSARCRRRLRKTLGPDAIETPPRGYRLRPGAATVDVQIFKSQVARARELLALEEPARAACTADQALRLWHGQPWAELEDWEPAAAEVNR